MKAWILLASVMLGGCASLSKEECRIADWGIIGFEDGSAGKSVATIGRHRQACAKVDVTPNLEEYERGHNKGLQHFCTQANGYSLGERGLNHNGVCSEHVETGFLQAFEQGKAVLDLRNLIDNRAEALSSLTEHLDQVEADIYEHEMALVRERDRSVRRKLVGALRDLQEERNHLVDDVDRTEFDIEVLNSELEELIRTHRLSGYR